MYYRQQDNVTPKGVYLPISKLHSILDIANLFFHNNISQICYCGQISSQLECCSYNCSFSDNLTLLGVTCIATINSKINSTPDGVYLHILKLHSILALANLLAHNNIWLIWLCDEYFFLWGTEVLL